MSEVCPRKQTFSSQAVFIFFFSFSFLLTVGNPCSSRSVSYMTLASDHCKVISAFQCIMTLICPYGLKTKEADDEAMAFLLESSSFTDK